MPSDAPSTQRERLDITENQIQADSFNLLPKVPAQASSSGVRPVRIYWIGAHNCFPPAFLSPYLQSAPPIGEVAYPAFLPACITYLASSPSLHGCNFGLGIQVQRLAVLRQRRENYGLGRYFGARILFGRRLTNVEVRALVVCGHNRRTRVPSTSSSRAPCWCRD